jgi:hypothetical protein
MKHGRMYCLADVVSIINSQNQRLQASVCIIFMKDSHVVEYPNAREERVIYNFWHYEAILGNRDVAYTWHETFNREMLRYFAHSLETR